MKNEIERRLRFADFAKVHFVSALHGTGVGKLYESIKIAYLSATHRLSAAKLTSILAGAVGTHQPPMIQGRRIKLRFAHSGGRNPPVIIIHGNQTESVPSHYTRYLERAFRRELGLEGTPVKVEFRTGENPYNRLYSGVGEGRKRRTKNITKYGKRNL